ncbi:hypothetical protein H8356DRAFT_1429439 [Neocallimastix lanati (nom. inval.)]|nr:hypothetical protein H8356DRAFT_1429439 [Neocallimastix sp. JGI-2020a]
MCECDCNKKDNYDCGYVSNCRYRDVNGKCGCDPKRNCPGNVDVTQKLNGQVVLVHTLRSHPMTIFQLGLQYYRKDTVLTVGLRGTYLHMLGYTGLASKGKLGTGEAFREKARKKILSNNMSSSRDNSAYIEMCNYFNISLPIRG